VGNLQAPRYIKLLMTISPSPSLSVGSGTLGGAREGPENTLAPHWKPLPSHRKRQNQVPKTNASPATRKVAKPEGTVFSNSMESFCSRRSPSTMR
jgi:hypothetical protein